MSPAAIFPPSAPSVPLAPPVATSLLVIGAGNLLLGDEGAGIHALRALAASDLPPGVRLLDGGTGGINLLSEFENAPSVVFLDATRDGQPAGTVTHLTPTEFNDLPRHLSAHDFGVRDLFAAATLLGQMPALHVFTISITAVQPMSLHLSAPVAAALPALVARVSALCADLLPPTRHSVAQC